MSKRTTARPSRAREPSRDLYAEVTAKIISELEQGCVPWVQPWGRSGTAGPALPRNALTGRTYSGINILILWSAVIEAAYPSQSWLTFRQAFAAGGSVRKGERGTTIFYADRFTPEKEKERARETGEDPRAILFLKKFTLFNVAQCEGLPSGLAADPAPLPEREIVPVAERLIAATGADIRIGGGEAYFVPSADYIQIPPQPAFYQQIDFYRTCFHELGHWSGHRSRLNRDQSGCFGSDAYGREELVAELASAFICATLGIRPSVRHADYLASWIAILKEDHRAIFRAASQASKAADFILGFQAGDADEYGTAGGDDEGRLAA